MAIVGACNPACCAPVHPFPRSPIRSFTRLQFRKRAGSTVPEFTVDEKPGSTFVLRGASRYSWLHGLDVVPADRISVTWRWFNADERYAKGAVWDWPWHLWPPKAFGAADIRNTRVYGNLDVFILDHRSHAFFGSTPPYACRVIYSTCCPGLSGADRGPLAIRSGWALNVFLIA